MTATVEETTTETTQQDTSYFDVVHAYCLYCYPEPSDQWVGKLCTTACGETAVFSKDYPADQDGIPLYPCPPCLETVRSLFTRCPKCNSGRTPK